MVHGSTSRTGGGLLLIRKVQQVRGCWRPKYQAEMPVWIALLPEVAHLGGGVSAGLASHDARNHAMGGVDRLSHASDRSVEPPGV
jgi:hypothetical protein